MLDQKHKQSQELWKGHTGHSLKKTPYCLSIHREISSGRFDVPSKENSTTLITKLFKQGKLMQGQKLEQDELRQNEENEKSHEF